MTIREQTEELEKLYLSDGASLSVNSRGRDVEEKECDMRTVYQRDRDKILHCKSFRRLKHKTQVFLSPEGDHYRTRLTHTLEVSQLARTVARALRINEDLADAIALGHDLGHTPFGHAGERALNEICPLPFAHNEQSIRVVEILENGGRGLNLTWEVRDGILNHRTSGKAATPEGNVVRFCDKLAYLHHDMDDAERAGLIREEDIPKDIRRAAGMTSTERLDHFLHDLISNSTPYDVKMSDEGLEIMMKLRAYMFANMYTGANAKREEGKAVSMLKQLYAYYRDNYDELPEEYILLGKERNEGKDRVICDYIAGMTDHFAIKKYEELFVPVPWEK